MLPIKIVSSYLSVEVFGPIFTQFTEGRDFKALSRTCKRLNEISRSTFVIANCSLSNRQYLLRCALRSNPSLMSIARGQAKPPENNFYSVFKTACANLNIDINSKDFSHCAFAISGVYTGFSDSILPHVYNDMLAAFADQPIEAITEDSLDEKINDLYTFSLEKRRTAVEREVRNCLKLKKGNLFFEFAKKLQNCRNERIAQIRERIKVECEAEKESILAELQILDGPGYLYGSVESSKDLLRRTLTRRNNAYLAFVHLTGLHNQSDLSDDKLATATPGVKAVFNELTFATHQFDQARENCIEVSARHNALVQRDAYGQVIGGKLYRVEKRLEQMNETAFNEFTLRVRFYFELDREISDSNEEIRHKALRRIILADPRHCDFSF